VLASLLTLGGLATLVVGGAAPAQAAGSDDEEALAQRYAPVVRLVHQTEPCGHGEPYRPSDVEAFLGRSDVALRGPWLTDDLIAVGPTADDLSAGLDGYHLDFPGNPLKPGCDYETWADGVTEGTEPTTYAHVVSEPDRPGRLALQYWFYYPFNDYNNKHESDWEMVQLLFDAATASEALDRDPVEIGYSQHSGTEVADWDDEKLEVLDGTHPVVYPAAGSHANYFDAALYLGHSSQQGFGCDDTRGPSDELRPTVRLVPSDPVAARAEFPWMGYRGHWGQREQSFYNGPTGPVTKGTWTRPISGQEERAHDRSFAVPAGGLFGTRATDLFCGGVAGGSDAARLLAGSPGAAVVIAVLALLVVLTLVRRTTWTPTAPLRVAHRRATGQIVAASARLYWRRRRLFASLGVPVVVAGLLATVLQSLVLDVSAGAAEGGEAGGLRVVLAAVIGYLVLGSTMVLVLAATTRAVVAIDAGQAVTPRSAFGVSLRRWRTHLVVFLAASLVIATLGFTIVLSAAALVLLLLVALVVPVVEVEAPTRTRALLRSAALVREGWAKVAVLLAASIVVAATVGPVLGLTLILAVGAPFPFANAIAGLTFALLTPYAGIALTYAYFDLRIRSERSRTTTHELAPEI
jgi:hypothetical protein